LKFSRGGRLVCHWVAASIRFRSVRIGQFDHVANFQTDDLTGVSGNDWDLALDSSPNRTRGSPDISSVLGRAGSKANGHEPRLLQPSGHTANVARGCLLLTFRSETGHSRRTVNRRACEWHAQRGITSIHESVEEARLPEPRCCSD